MKNSKLPTLLMSANVGIITALPEEYAAVRAVLGCKTEIDVLGKGPGRKYSVASVKTKSGDKHAVAVALLSDTGNNSAAIRATAMVHHCPNVEYFIMVGIAGAIPNPKKAKDHVRLGDIVVSDRNGVIQYDFIKKNASWTEHRFPPRPPGATLIQAVRSLTVRQLENKRPWNAHIKAGIAKLGQKWKRLGDATDILVDKPAPAAVVTHPKDDERLKGQPRVFHGPIASANILLKDPVVRDALRDKFGVKAVEMEGSGVADATWELDKGYLVIRGTCDYCNPSKGDAWHNYAALVAAAYARCVIEHLASTGRAQVAIGQKAKPTKKRGVKQPQDIKRERDLEQLKRVFYWIHPKVMDQFIDRLGYSKITFIGLDFFEGLERVIESHWFHISDTALEKHVKKFFQKWADCFRYTGMMDDHPNGQEAYFRMPADIPTSQEQADACHYTARTAKPLRDALVSLLNYVRAHYIEINPTESGKEALAAYIKEKKRVERLYRVRSRRRTRG